MFGTSSSGSEVRSKQRGDSSELVDPGFRERLAAVIGDEQPFAWAARVGIPRATFSRIWKEGAPPRAVHLKRIAEATGVSLDWLLTGEGSMYRAVGRPAPEGSERRQAGHAEAEESRAHGAPARREDDAFVEVPVYSVKASAGHGAEVLQEKPVDWLHFKREWIRRELRASVADLYLLYVEGDSMEPTLCEGDIVLVQKRGTEPLRDGIHVLRMANSLHVKRVQFLPGGKIEVTSDNPAYKAFTIDLTDEAEASQVELVGRVIWCGKRM